MLEEITAQKTEQEKVFSIMLDGPLPKPPGKSQSVGPADKAASIKVVKAHIKSNQTPGPTQQKKIGLSDEPPKQPRIEEEPVPDMADAGEDSDDEGIEVKLIDTSPVSKLDSGATNLTTADGAYPEQAKHGLPLDVPGRDSVMMNPRQSDASGMVPDASMDVNLFHSDLDRSGQGNN